MKEEYRPWVVVKASEEGEVKILASYTSYLLALGWMRERFSREEQEKRNIRVVWRDEKGIKWDW